MGRLRVELLPRCRHLTAMPPNREARTIALEVEARRQRKACRRTVAVTSPEDDEKLKEEAVPEQSQRLPVRGERCGEAETKIAPISRRFETSLNARDAAATK